MSLLKEFKEFISRGNVLDLAIGVIIGAAFGAVVDSFVKDLFMPPLGMILSDTDFKDLKYVLKEASGENAAVAIHYGLFIQKVINFFIIAWFVFLLMKAYNRFIRKGVVVPLATPQEVLLAEIRDLLKAQNQQKK